MNLKGIEVHNISNIEIKKDNKDLSNNTRSNKNYAYCVHLDHYYFDFNEIQKL